MKDLYTALLSIFTGVVIIAIVSVFVSKKSATPQVFQSAGSALGNVIAAAVNPASINVGVGNTAASLGNPAATSLTNGNNGNNVLTAPSLQSLLGYSGIG